MSGMIKLEKYKEEVEGKILGGGCDEVSIIPVVYPRGMVSVSSLVYFYLLVLLLNVIILTFLSLLHHSIFNSISIRIGVESENPISHCRIFPGARSGGRKLG